MRDAARCHAGATASRLRACVQSRGKQYYKVLTQPQTQYLPKCRKTSYRFGTLRSTAMKDVGQDAWLVAAHNKGFGSAATVLGWTALSGVERGAAMKAVGQDAWLVAAHNKGFGSAATVLGRTALSGAERGAAMKAVGQDAQLVAAYTKGLGGAATVNGRNALSGAERGAAMKAAGQSSQIAGGHKRGVPGVGTPEEYASMPPAQQHEMMRLVHADRKQTRDQNLNQQGILSSAQILAQRKEEGLGLPVSAMQQVAKRNDTQTQGTQIEIDTALAGGAEPSKNDGHKSFKQANRIVVEFNQRLKQDCLMKLAGPSEQNNEKLRVYLGSKGISTTGGLVGEKVFETMARLDKMLQKYRLSHKLNLIQKLEPIDARAFALSKIAAQKKVQARTLRATKKSSTGKFLFLFFVSLFFVDGRHGARSSLEVSMVIEKDRHADRATRLEKALDDEGSADRTELEQGIAPLLARGYTGGQLQKARGGVGWSDRRERIDKMDERARERAEGGGGRGYDKNTLSIYIPFRPGAEEWWEGGAELREGLECLEHEEKEYMAPRQSE